MRTLPAAFAAYRWAPSTKELARRVGLDPVDDVRNFHHVDSPDDATKATAAADDPRSCKRRQPKHLCQFDRVDHEL